MKLNAASRWAVTGTPIHNSLMDLAGLIQFLKFDPYDDPKSFDSDILEPLRQGDKTESIRRLKALCHAVMVRRSKAVIQLPPRQDLIRTVNFSRDEALFYRRIETADQNVLEEATNTHAETRRMQIRTIQLINRMRLFCNLGLSMATKGASSWGPELSSPWTGPDTGDSIETTVASETALGATTCAQCAYFIDIPDTTTGNPYAYYSACVQVYCQSCAALNNYEAAESCSCPGETPCTLRLLSPKIVQTARGVGSTTSAESFHAVPSSKVQAVIEEVQASLPEKR
jgi:SWI/SNF-related matrix-associated actin-dependent regulator of chromatin subfamily A3